MNAYRAKRLLAQLNELQGEVEYRRAKLNEARMQCWRTARQLHEIDPHAKLVMKPDNSVYWIGGDIMGLRTTEIGLSDSTLHLLERVQSTHPEKYRYVYQLIVDDPTTLFPRMKGCVAARDDIAAALERLSIRELTVILDRSLH